MINMYKSIAKGIKALYKPAVITLTSVIMGISPLIKGIGDSYGYSCKLSDKELTCLKKEEGKKISQYPICVSLNNRSNDYMKLVFVKNGKKNLYLFLRDTIWTNYPLPGIITKKEAREFENRIKQTLDGKIGKISDLYTRGSVRGFKKHMDDHFNLFESRVLLNKLGVKIDSSDTMVIALSYADTSKAKEKKPVIKPARKKYEKRYKKKPIVKVKPAIKKYEKKPVVKVSKKPEYKPQKKQPSDKEFEEQSIAFFAHLKAGIERDKKERGERAKRYADEKLSAPSYADTSKAKEKKPVVKAVSKKPEYKSITKKDLSKIIEKFSAHLQVFIDKIKKEKPKYWKEKVKTSKTYKEYEKFFSAPYLGGDKIKKDRPDHIEIFKIYREFFSAPYPDKVKDGFLEEFKEGFLEEFFARPVKDIAMDKGVARVIKESEPVKKSKDAKPEWAKDLSDKIFNLYKKDNKVDNLKTLYEYYKKEGLTDESILEDLKDFSLEESIDLIR